MNITNAKKLSAFTLALLLSGCNLSLELVNTGDAQAVNVGEVDSSIIDSGDSLSNDFQVDEDIAAVTGEVGENNTVPVVVKDLFEVVENNSIILSGLLDNDIDEDGDEIVIESFKQAEHGVIDEVNGLLTYTPELGFNGLDQFSYTISDGYGGQAEGDVVIYVRSAESASIDESLDSGNEEMILPVVDNTIIDSTTAEAAANKLPVVGSDVVEVDMNSFHVMSTLLDNDTDADGDSLVINSFVPGAYGSVSSQNGVLTYTPNTNFTGFDRITYSVSDGRGGEASGEVVIFVRESTAVIINEPDPTVVAVNAVPEVVGDIAEVQEDSFVIMSTLLDNDTDADGDTLTIESFSQGAYGSVEITMMGLKYTPNTDYNGLDVVRYTVSDGQGGQSSGSVVVYIRPVNDVPIAVSDAVAALQSTSASFNVLSNDISIGDGVNVSLLSDVQNGSLMIGVDGEVTYTPAGDYFGTDSFSYQIMDVDGDVSVSTVDINVACVNNCERVFTLAWDASLSANVAGYRVYTGRTADNLNEVIEVGNVTSYSHTVYLKGDYYFAVTTMSDSAVESDMTSILSGTY